MDDGTEDLVPPSPTWCDMTFDIREVRMEDQCGVVPRGFLCCRLCHEEYRQPKLLPCLHSFCKECLQTHVEKNKDENGYFGCPVCGTETTLKRHKVEKLPDNVFARRLSNPVISLPKPLKREKTCRNCRQFGQKHEVSHHCINCDDFLCQNCSESHQLQVETASHCTQSMHEYETQSKPKGLLDLPNMPKVLHQCCEYYDTYDIGAMFCVDCDMAVCVDCHAQSHEQHRCAELTAVSQNFETKIRAPLEDLSQDNKTLKKTLKELDLADKVIQKQQLKLRNDVKKRTKILCDLINDYETALLAEIDKHYSHNVELITHRRSEIDLHIASIQAVTDLTEKLVSFGSEEEKVSLRKKIGRRVRELCETELPTNAIDLVSMNLSEPDGNVEKICDFFGELRTGVTNCSRRSSRTHSTSYPTVDSARHSVSDYADNDTEVTDLDDLEGVDHDMLSASNTSETFRSIKEEPEDELEHTSSSLQSYTQEEVPSASLTTPTKEVPLPSTIHRDCIKGMGVNMNGDIIIGTAAAAGQHSIYYMEKRGIIRGQIPVEKGWIIHSVGQDGKVAITVTRGDNRYKVKILSNDGCGTVLTDLHLESFGLNCVSAYTEGQVIISSSRYAQLNRNYGKSPKSGGNIAVYNKSGHVVMLITNEDFSDDGLYLFEKPQNVAVDDENNFFVCDPSSHIVSGFDKDGVLLFEYGNNDTDGEIYQGPDFVCVDHYKNVIITDKKEGRIDLLSYDGLLQKCLFLEDNIKFISVSPDKMLVLGTTEGTIKFYEYL